VTLRAETTNNEIFDRPVPIAPEAPHAGIFPLKIYFTFHIDRNKEDGLPPIGLA
jgi:hypothetical protein